LEAGYPIAATIPLMITNAFKNIAALSLESGYKVKEVDQAASSGPAVEAPVVKKEEKKEAPKKEAPPPPPAAEEEEMDMGDLFG